MVVPERPVLVAPDAFKGTLSAPRVAAALGRGLERAGLEAPDLCPVADGGEGTLDMLLPRLGGETGAAQVSDPLGRSVTASFGLIEDGDCALVESAAASGLALLQPDELDPERTTTHGTGELIAAAIDAGARVVLVGGGGSATVDGGAGAIEAIEEHGGLHGARLVVLCDVRTPWELAAARYGPQKGASPAAVRRLERRLDELARTLPRDPRGVAGTGTAGGLAGGLWAAYGATLEPGAPFVLGALDFDERVLAARAVICGEGAIDEQTLHGKVVGEIGTRCRQRGVPLYAVVGRNAIDRFAARMIDLMEIHEATTPEELEAAGEALGRGALAVRERPELTKR